VTNEKLGLLIASYRYSKILKKQKEQNKKLVAITSQGFLEYSKTYPKHLLAQMLSDYIAEQIKTPKNLKDFFFKVNLLLGIKYLLPGVLRRTKKGLFWTPGALKKLNLKNVSGIKVVCSGK